jgi:hypothetical protein
VRRFRFNIASSTPVKDLLPDAPAVKPVGTPLLVEDLAQVPEVLFQAPAAKELVGEEAMKNTALSIAKINVANERRVDGFLEALRGARLDLAGLPFAMGDACRTKGERSRQFNLAVATVRRALQPGIQTAIMPNPPPATPAQGSAPAGAVTGGAIPTPAGGPVAPPAQPALRVVTEISRPEGFWEQYESLCAQEDRALPRVDRACQEHLTLARIAALMQVLAPESPELRLGLVKYLSGVAHVEATRALARLALFSPEDEICQAAVQALQVRRERDYTDVLLRGLRYPWPPVARHATEALVKLERTDLVPQLVNLLDEPDPRAPVCEEKDGQRVSVVRELVRVNHHRSCLLCHAPGNTGKVSTETLTAEVPVPDQPLPTPFEGYRTTSPDLLVRIDVTYLRQDFSVRQPVADANPWPEMQRFDYLVRSRVLSDKEADTYRTRLEQREPGRPSPYQRVALAALRDLTGRDTEPTAEAWRRLLGLTARRQ